MLVRVRRGIFESLTPILASLIFGGVKENPKDTSGISTVPQNEYPFIAHIKFHSREQDYVCGGTILDSRYILTAASCLNGNDADRKKIDNLADYKIAVGCTKESKCQHNHTAQLIIIHEDFGPHGMNDIALVKTKEPIEWQGDQYMGPLINPVQLETDDNCTRPNEYHFQRPNLFLVGWSSDLRGERMDDLKYSEYSRPEVEPWESDLHTETSGTYGISDQKASQACFYDYGSPLLDLRDIAFDPWATYLQVGIVNMGVTVCDTNQVSQMSFTRVPTFYSWIQNCIQGDTTSGCKGVISKGE